MHQVDHICVQVTQNAQQQLRQISNLLLALPSFSLRNGPKYRSDCLCAFHNMTSSPHGVFLIPLLIQEMYEFNEFMHTPNMIGAKLPYQMRGGLFSGQVSHNNVYMVLPFIWQPEEGTLRVRNTGGKKSRQ